MQHWEERRGGGTSGSLVWVKAGVADAAGRGGSARQVRARPQV